MQPNEIIEVKSVDVIQAIDRAEVDVQIATAKQYPRDVAKVLNTIKTYGQMDAETAQDCFYAVKRGGDLIEGISVRFAEIIAGAWGNLRVATRIIGNDGKTITAQGICHDLETNLAVSVEVKRRITDKNGKVYSEDMQVLTGNAASAIAFRNAVLKVVPKAITKKVIDETRKVALGSVRDIETRRKNVVEHAKKFGVTVEHILFYCDVSKLESIDNEMLLNLRGAFNAISEGGSTAEELFFAPLKEHKKQLAASKTATTAKEKAEQAMATSVK